MHVITHLMCVLVIYTITVPVECCDQIFDVVVSAAEPGVVITSANYPRNYYNNQDICWSVQADNGAELWIEDYNIEECCDSLTVYDGDSVSAPVLRALVGNGTEEHISGYTNSLFIQFNTDSSVTKHGFQACICDSGSEACRDQCRFRNRDGSYKEPKTSQSLSSSVWDTYATYIAIIIGVIIILMVSIRAACRFVPGDRSTGTHGTLQNANADTLEKNHSGEAETTHPEQSMYPNLLYPYHAAQTRRISSCTTADSGFASVNLGVTPCHSHYSITDHGHTTNVMSPLSINDSPLFHTSNNYTDSLDSEVPCTVNVDITPAPEEIGSPAPEEIDRPAAAPEDMDRSESSVSPGDNSHI